MDETDQSCGVPYFLPKALVHLTITSKTNQPDEKQKEKKDAGSQDITNNVSVIVSGKENVQTGASGGSGREFNDPIADAPVDSNEGTNAIPAPTPANNNESVSKLKATEDNNNEKDYVQVTSQYTIKVETHYEADHSAGPYYAHYSPNWFFSEDVTLGTNAKQLLATSEATSSDRTAQVIYNLADTAINAVKIASVFASGVPTFQVTKENGAKSVVYKKLNIDVTFDPFSPEDVKKVQSLFKDKETSTTNYISPFSLKITNYGENAFERLPKKEKLSKGGLYFREPTLVEIEVVSRETEFLNSVAKEVEISSKNSDTSGKQQHDKLFAQLKVLRTNVGDHSERFVVVVPNKNRVFAFNVDRSSFTQNKATTLSITDGQLTQFHIKKPSEAEGLSEIPLEISKKLLALPKDLLTYRKELVTSKGDLNTAELSTFNSGESLQNAVANSELARRKAALDARAAVITSETAEIQALTSRMGSMSAIERADLEARTARLKAEAAELDAQAALLKSQSAVDGAAK